MRGKRLSVIALLLISLIVISGCCLRVIIRPPAISLIAPEDGATDQRTTLVLTWEATEGVSRNKKIPPEIVEYRFYIALINEDYGDGEPTEDKQVEKEGLEYDAAYKWKVEAIQSDNQIGKSEEWTFTTEKKQYAAPQIELTNPASGATDLATTVTLTWEATEGKQTNAGEREGVNITEYRVYHKKTGDPDPTEPATTTEKSYNLTNLEYAATYTWYVVALQSDGQQATSTESTFTTQAVQYDIPEIALKSPGNRVGGQPTTVNLTWEATPGKQTNAGERAPTIESYLVYFGVDGQNYGDPVEVTATQTTKPGLAYGTTYKWQVVALQSNEKRATSTEWTFSTLAPVYGPPTIELKSPEDKATGLTTPVKLEWEAAPGAQTNVGERAVSLTFQVHYQKEGGNEKSVSAGNQYYYDLTDLDADATYTWYVVARQSDDQTKKSDEWTFKTRAGGATEKPIKRYNSSGALQKDYDKLSDAINEADNEDHIVVVGGTKLKNETQQVTISGTEVTIYSSPTNDHFTIDMSGKNSRVFHITNGASVTIRDAIIKGGDATDATPYGGGGIRITGSSTITTINATIIDNTAGIGGGVYVDEGCAFNAFYTTIASNTATKGTGGGVDVYLGTFNANNVIIRKNQAKGGVGIVYSRDVSQMKLVGGDAAAVLDGAFNAVGRSIRDKTEANGGGVAVRWDGIFNATETTIMENNAEGDDANGGGVVLWRSTFNAYSGTAITGNTAKAEGGEAYGGGVVVDSGGTFNAYEGAKITENRAEGPEPKGGGVAVLTGTFNAYEGTEITDNRADGFFASGGGVAVQSQGTFNAMGTTIESNTVNGTQVYGGGVFVSRNGSVIASNVDIKLNQANGPEPGNGHSTGGGVAVHGGTFEAKDETSISSNTARYGGGVSVEHDRVGEEAAVPGTFNAEDRTVISDNYAIQEGGGIWWVAVDKNSNEILGKITTNGKDWTPQEDRQDNFSVDMGGNIHGPVDNDPVQVFQNTALEEGTQMKVKK